MNISKFNSCVVIEENPMVKRRESLYRLVNENMYNQNSETTIIAALTKIAFIDYLLGVDVMDNTRLNTMITNLNNNRSTNLQLTDFYIRF